MGERIPPTETDQERLQEVHFRRQTSLTRREKHSPLGFLIRFNPSYPFYES